jgi:hypothetical protein
MAHQAGGLVQLVLWCCPLPFASPCPTSLPCNDVIVSPLVAGEVIRLPVNEGDTVTRGQLLAVMRPDELRADSAYYGHSAEGAAVQV